MKQSVLVVDDDLQILELYRRISRRMEQRFDMAASGSDALLCCREHRYDLVLLDLKLPDMDGVEVLREIQRSAPATSVYFVTGFYQQYMDRLKTAAMEGLRFEVIQKPIGVDRVLAVVESVLTQDAGRTSTPGKTGPAPSEGGPK